MYLDESGDLGKQSRYLIISALMVDNPADLQRIIKNMRRYKFKKELKKAVEIKANSSSDAVIKYMLEKLNSVKGSKVFYMILEKKKTYSEFLKTNKNKLYNYVAGKLAKNIILEELDLEIKIDKSKGKQLLQSDFNNYFCLKIREKSNIRKININHSYSHSWEGLQFADILSWALFQKFEHGNNEYIDILKIEKEIYHCF